MTSVASFAAFAATVVCPSNPVQITDTKAFPGGVEVPYVFLPETPSGPKLLYGALMDRSGHQALYAQTATEDPQRLIGTDSGIPGRDRDNFTNLMWAQGRAADGLVSFVGRGPSGQGVYALWTPPGPIAQPAFKLRNSTDPWPNSADSFAAFGGPLLLTDGTTAGTFGLSGSAKPSANRTVATRVRLGRCDLRSHIERRRERLLPLASGGRRA